MFAVDPGTKQSGWALVDGQRVCESGTAPNEHLLERIRVVGAYVLSDLLQPTMLALERFEARGMPIGDESIETILWTGRFMQAWHMPDQVLLVRRSAVKLALCGTTKAKDANIRQALIDRLGAPGTKKAQGPTYGVTSHAWAALAVAVTAAGSAA